MLNIFKTSSRLVRFNQAQLYYLPRNQIFNDYFKKPKDEFYSLLGLDKNATKEDVKNAFNSKLNEFKQADMNPLSSENKQKVQEAYDYIMKEIENKGSDVKSDMKHAFQSNAVNMASNVAHNVADTATNVAGKAANVLKSAASTVLNKDQSTGSSTVDQMKNDAINRLNSDYDQQSMRKEQTDFHTEDSEAQTRKKSRFGFIEYGIMGAAGLFLMSTLMGWNFSGKKEARHPPVPPTTKSTSSIEKRDNTLKIAPAGKSSMDKAKTMDSTQVAKTQFDRNSKAQMTDSLEQKTPSTMKDNIVNKSR